MVRIRRQGFPSRMPFLEFEARFSALLLDMARLANGKGGAGSPSALQKVGSTLKRIVTAPANRDEEGQAEAEVVQAKRMGTEACLTILKRANMFEHRHYQFGKTLVFLRNGVEGALMAAVEKQMLAVNWFQKEARKRVAMREFAVARKAAVAVQKEARRRQAKRLVGKRLAVLRRRQDALRKGYYAVRIARAVSRHGPDWMARRATSAIQCQRLARGFLARRHARWLIVMRDRPQPLARLRSACRAHVLAFRACRRLLASSEETRARKAAEEAARAKAGAIIQARARGRRTLTTFNNHRRAAVALQGFVKRRFGGASAHRQLLEAVNAAFRAVFADDEDAVARCLRAAPWLILVRQNRAGQRAGLLHAAAAGGSVRVAPMLLHAALKASVACGRATAPAAPPSGASKAEVEALRLRVAMQHALSFKDTLGRTPLHYAARWGQLPFVRWAIRILTHARHAGADAVVAGSSPASGSSASAAALPSAAAVPSAAEAVEGAVADEEIRRAIVAIVPPGGASRQRVLVVLGQARLKVYPLPPKAGASVTASSIDVTTLGKPAHSFASKCLYRKSSDRLKRDCIEIVILKQRKGNKALAMAAKFESQASSEDILELYAGSPLETRHWLAAFHTPRYLAARGMHLANALTGGADAPRQLDLWARWALVNTTDARGEGLLAMALRGVETGDENDRGRLVAWLLDAGAEVMPFVSGGHASPSAAAAALRRASTAGMALVDAPPTSSPTADGVPSVAAAGGALALLLHLAATAASVVGAGGGGQPAAWTGRESLPGLILHRAATRLGAAARALSQGARRVAPALGKAPLTLAVLNGSIRRKRAPSRVRERAGGGPGSGLSRAGSTSGMIGSSGAAGAGASPSYLRCPRPPRRTPPRDARLHASICLARPQGCRRRAAVARRRARPPRPPPRPPAAARGGVRAPPASVARARARGDGDEWRRLRWVSLGWAELGGGSGRIGATAGGGGVAARPLGQPSSPGVAGGLARQGSKAGGVIGGGLPGSRRHAGGSSARAHRSRAASKSSLWFQRVPARRGGRPAAPQLMGSAGGGGGGAPGAGETWAGPRSLAKVSANSMCSCTRRRCRRAPRRRNAHARRLSARGCTQSSRLA